MSSVSSYIKGSVLLSLKEAKKRSIKVTSMKSSDLGSTMQKYQKFLTQINEEAQELQEKMDKLKKIFITAAINTKNTVDQIAEAIGVLRDTKEDSAKLAAMMIQMKHDFGDNPAAKSLMQEFEKTKQKFATLAKEREQFLSDIGRTHVPVYLTTNDQAFFKPFLIWVVKDLKKEDNGADIHPKESKYIPGINDSKRREIRWARFIPLVNIPTTDGGKRNLFLVVCITFMQYSDEKGRITPMTITDDRGMEKPAISQYSIGLTSKIMDPIKMSPNLKVVSSVQNAIQVLAYLAQKEGLAVFGEEIEGTVKDRMDKVNDKMTILNKEGVIVKKDKNGRNFILVKVPKNLVDTNANAGGRFSIPSRPSKFDGDLYIDVCRYAGLPVNTPFNSGRLRLERVYAEGNYICFIYRVVPIADTEIKSDFIKQPKKETPVLDADFDSGNGFGGFNETGINDLVNDWLGKNNKF